jgi:ABC-type enterochelin transport system permease subunit
VQERFKASASEWMRTRALLQSLSNQKLLTPALIGLEGTLTLSQKDMLIDGKRVNLSPGMNITAEIKTGQRRIIEFLLSPVQRAGSESLRER